MKFLSVFFCLIAPLLYANNELVLSTKRIVLEEYPDAYNPSIIKVDEGYLMVFRYNPSPAYLWLSYIGVVLLDEEFNLISRPQLLKIRPQNSKTLSQAEDARIFSYKGRMFLIYNDNIDTPSPTDKDKREMFMAELFCNEGFYTISTPRKLVYEEKRQHKEKNWTPFEYNGNLLITYTVHPHEILAPNLANGLCYRFDMTEAEIVWDWGTLRCSTPPVLDEGEYLAFFHSGVYTASPSSWGFNLWHYFMGAYTFAAKPPFHITRISPSPIIAEGFYTQSSYWKRVVYPGGCVVSGPRIHIAYGKDDSEIWIATLDKAALKRTLVLVESNQ